MKNTKHLVATVASILVLASLPLFGQSGGPVSVSPTQLTFNSTNSSPAPAQNLVVTSNTGAPVAFSVSVSPSGAWLNVSATSGTTPAAVSVSVAPGSMAAGTYAGFVTITASSSNVTVPVTLNWNVSGTSTLSAAPPNLTFNIPLGSSLPQSQQVNLTNSSPPNISFTATPVTGTGGNWLFVNPTSATTPGTLTVTVNPANLAAGTFQGAVAIDPPGTTGIIIPVAVNIAAPPTVNVSPQQLSFAFQTGTNAPAAQTLNVTASGGGNISFSATPSTSSCGSSWLVVAPQTSATPSAVSVQINTAGLTPNNCSGTITIAAPGASNPTQTIPVSLLVSANPLMQVPSTGPTFNYQLGTATPSSQTVQITSSSTPLTFNVTTSPVSGGPNFLTVNPLTGTTPQALTLAINPTVLAGLGPNTYAENVTVSSAGAGNSPQTFTVTLVVSANPALVTSQSSVTFNYQIGQTSPPSQVITLSSTGAPQSFSVATSTTNCTGFLSASPATGITAFQAGQQTQIIVSANTTGLTTPQTCNGTVTITASGATNSPVSIPVTMNVSATPLINASPGAINAIAIVGAAAATASISLVSTDNSTALNFTATAVTNPPGLTWLAVTPNTGSTPATLNVVINPANLFPGQYTGSINITSTSPNVPSQSIPVTLVVASTSITMAPTALSFSQPIGGSVPPAQMIQLSGLPAGVTIGTTVIMLNGTGWLTSTTSGSTITVTANGTNLAPGTYSGVVTVFIPGAANSPLYLPVTFTVGGAPLFLVSPATVNLTYQQNGALPTAQTIQISSASGSVPFTAVAALPPGTASGGVLFATVSPTSGNTPSSLSVSANPAVLATIAPGTYTNVINLTSGSQGATQTLTVTLTVTPPAQPAINALLNSGSFLGGGVSAGELVTIFGSNIGPAVPAGLVLTSAGAVATSLGKVTVTFNGIPAALIYVSANQINVIVPYEMASVATANIVVNNDGVQSPLFPVPIVPSAPAIFSLSQNGSGQGAILNADLSVNGSTNPAARGTAIVIYGTGEGQTTPGGITASVTPVAGPYPKPNLPVTVSIGGQPATVAFVGEAPGLVSGVLQVNAIVPTNIGTGNQPVVITVGGVSSPNVITAFIK